MTWGCALAIMLLFHFLADFYVQTDAMARTKGSDRGQFAKHCALYAFVVGGGALSVFQGSDIVIVWLILGASHAVIDTVKCWVSRRRSSFDLALFCVDQAAHVIMCALVVTMFSTGGGPLDFLRWLGELLGATVASESLVVVLTFLIVWKPACIWVNLLLRSIEPRGENRKDDVLCEECAAEGDGESGNECEGEESLEGAIRAGKWIGMLERTIVATMTLWGEFGAIAFVLTAKSIARFDLLKNRDFAERYLVGTLASAASAIVVALAIRGMVM